MPSCLAKAAKKLSQRHLQVGHILPSSCIQRLSDARLIRAAWQPKSADQHRIKTNRGGGLADRFGSEKSMPPETSPAFATSELGEHFLPNLRVCI
jgi:hypothetical protein